MSAAFTARRRQPPAPANARGQGDPGSRSAILANAPARADYRPRRRMTLCDLTLAEARDGLRRRDFTATEIAAACLDAIAALNTRLNAFVTVTAKGACAGGGSRPPPHRRRNGTLLGVPLAIDEYLLHRGRAHDRRRRMSLRSCRPTMHRHRQPVRRRLPRQGEHRRVSPWVRPT